ncbi:MAG: DUF4395 domain-containing protein [Chloroflexi bacterium]|nr:MAG: DUF4395 domain-containing protein [Chloroflexota bacterium]
MKPKVDHTALRVNQVSIIGLLILAFLFDQWWLVAFVAAVMLIGTAWPKASLFKLVYARLLKPAGLLQPDLQPDDPQPHLFAQGVGGIFLAASTLALLAGAPLLGWSLAGIVVILAAVNLFFGFCVGCFLYFQLARRGVHLSLPGWQNV